MQKSVSLLIVLFFSTLFVSCGQETNKQNSKNAATIVEVLYFHATGRCPTCLAVDNTTKKILEENFKPEMASGLITFASINFDEADGKTIANQCGVSFSTLLIIKKGEKEIKTDFTDAGWENAEKNPEKFKELLIEEIKKNLN